MFNETLDQALGQPIPRKPDWFDEELLNIAGRNEFGEPRIICTNGKTATTFRAGRPDAPKYPMQERGRRVIFDFRVWNTEKIGYEEFSDYPSLAYALETRPELDGNTKQSRKRVEVTEYGSPCWYIETFVSPDEIDPQDWERRRYRYLEDASGLEIKVDLIGAFPIKGRYVLTLAVVDEKGRPIEPNRQTLDEVRRRWHSATTDTRSLEQRLRDDETAREKREQKRDAEIEYAVKDIFKTVFK